jgi:hypothetical protein
MPNFFDQFDPPAAPVKGGNFFDQFDVPLPQERPNPNAIGGLGSEIGRAFNENLDAVKRVYSDYQPGEQMHNLATVGKAIAAVPGMIASPVTGAARASIGRGMEAIDPLTEQQRTQYGLPDARSMADTAMMGLAPRNASPVGMRTVQPPTPGPSDVMAARDSAYQNPAVTGLQIDPQAAKNFVDTTRQGMLTQKVDPIVAPTVDKLLTNLEAPRFGPTHGLSDFDLVRQSLGDVPYTEGRAAGIARKSIDSYLGNIPPKDVVSGNAALAKELLLDARGNHAALKRYEDVADALARADNQAPSIYSGQNVNNATRQQFRPILNEKMGVSKSSGFQDFTPAELAQTKKVVHGTTTGNLARFIEKEMSKLPIPFVGRLAGLPARAVGNASTRRQAEKLAEALMSRSPLAQSLPPVPVAGPNPVVAGAAGPNSVAQLLAALLSRQPSLVPARAENQQ